MKIDAEAIFFEHYRRGSALADLLWDHSRRVRDKALAVTDALPGERIDRDFIEAAALLHDIGVIETDAPSIHCHGSQPYIRHGLIGRGMLEARGLEQIGLVCERHIGTGITVGDIVHQHLPLPFREMLPESPEETVVCYADKFFSKTDGGREHTPDEVVAELSRYGPEKAAVFKRWQMRFEGRLDPDGGGNAATAVV
jgi:uncharacterized protein